MHQARSITVQDFDTDCPVALDLVARLMRTDADALPSVLKVIPEPTRARLALWLYGRSHTRVIGVRVAATCEAISLHRAGGLAGRMLHDLSRQPYTQPDGTARSTSRQVSLGGPRIAA